jgi:hypothetical protein
MKSIVVTITTVIEVGDNVKIEEIKNNNDLGQHILINGHMLQPIIDFAEYQGIDKDGSHNWGPLEDDDIGQLLIDGIGDEGYSILEINNKEN